MKWTILLPLLLALAAITAAETLLSAFTPSRRRRDGKPRDNRSNTDE